MIGTILIPAIAIGSLGLLFGLVLAFASKVFHVDIDPKIEKILEALPGANCGACGLPGCSGYAEAIVTQGMDFTLCAPGGGDSIKKIAEILGKTASDKERKVAVIHCKSGGYKNTNLRFEYKGISTCKAAVLLSNGPNLCNFGCVFQNDCIEACKFDAIHINDEGMRIVDQDKCTGCAACAKVCPRSLIEIVPVSKKVHIMCTSMDKGPLAKKNCGNNTACIGCGLCLKSCPVNAIKIENYLAKIDYTLCVNCGLCAKKCPTKAIDDNKENRGKAFIIEENCIGCTICAKKCPVQCIEGELKKIHKIDAGRCIGCEVCLSKCPKKAIEIRFNL